MEKEERTDVLLRMMEQPEQYTEQQWLDVLNDDECRELYTLMCMVQGCVKKAGPLMAGSLLASPKGEGTTPPAGGLRGAGALRVNRMARVAAIFVGVLLISGLAFAASRMLTHGKSAESASSEQQAAEPRMLKAFIVPADCKNPVVKKRGDGILVTWVKGTWVQMDEGGFVEDHAVCAVPWLFHIKWHDVKLNGTSLDIRHLPDLPASALKKVEIHDGWVNLITTPVQIPADVRGSINPELTILLTGTPPKGGYVRSSIYIRQGIHDTYDWRDYTYTSWSAQADNIRYHLEDVAIRRDHHVRVNICRGVPQKHISRIRQLLEDSGVTNYELTNQE